MEIDNKPEVKYKVSNDFVKTTMTCTVSKYTIENLNRKQDNTPFKVCNINAYIAINGKLENIKIVVYNSRIIDLFEKYDQINKRILVDCKLSFRTYEKDGNKQKIVEFVIGDSETLQIIGSRKGSSENKDDKDTYSKDYNNNSNVINNNYKKNSNKDELADLENFDLDEFIQNGL